MALRTPPRKKRSTPPAARQSRGAQTHESKLRALIRAGRRIDPTNRRAVSRAYSEFKRRESLERNYGHAVTPTMARILRDKGFYVSKKKSPVVVVDVPRNVHREKIPHTHFSVLKSGIVKFTNTERRDFIIGFTKEEKREFANNPGEFTARKVAEFKRDYPQYARYVKPASIRLQWGAFQATKQFAPSYFTQTYFASISSEETRKVKKGKRKPRIDKLTGLHITIFVPQKKARNAHKRKARSSGRGKGRRS